MISIGYHRQIKIILKQQHLKIKQMDGGDENLVGKNIPLDVDNAVEVPVDLLKSKINDKNKLYEIYKYYQPLPGDSLVL